MLPQIAGKPTWIFAKDTGGDKKLSQHGPVAESLFFQPFVVTFDYKRALWFFSKINNREVWRKGWGVCMRFEVVAAFALGVLLPVLETVRRGITHWSVNFTTMFEDYLGGAVLLTGAWAVYKSKSWGAVFLLLAWGSISGLMTSSFVAQLEATIRQTATEPHNLVVLIVKFLLWSICMVSLLLSFRSATQRRPV